MVHQKGSAKQLNGAETSGFSGDSPQKGKCNGEQARPPLVEFYCKFAKLCFEQGIGPFYFTRGLRPVWNMEPPDV